MSDSAAPRPHRAEDAGRTPDRALVCFLAAAAVGLALSHWCPRGPLTLTPTLVWIACSTMTGLAVDRFTDWRWGWVGLALGLIAGVELGRLGKDFVVATVDQRGTGASYSQIEPTSTLTTATPTWSRPSTSKAHRRTTRRAAAPEA